MINQHYILTENDTELKQKVENALDDATSIIRHNLSRYSSGTDYPCRYHDGQYTMIKNGDPEGCFWTESFWPGQLWLAYEVTGEQEFRDLAEKNLLDFYRRVDLNHEIDWHHDLGFLYTLSSVAPYKLTGNKLGREAALMAAYSLSRRFRHRGSFIQSMGDDGDYMPQNYRFIIDTVMNLPLLFWATEETGDMRYKDKAMRHLKTAIKYIVREDGSTYHHFLMDQATGGPIRGLTLQGAGDESCWSRGQAWPIYGIPLAYGYTGDESLLNAFCRITDYFMEHLPSDYIPYWDFIYGEGSDEPRDSSASAIACCGIMEMARLVPHDTCNMEKYLDYAKKMLHSLIDNYATKKDSGHEALLLHVTGSKPHNNYDSCSSYGDYFYLEALVRASRDWKAYW